MSQTVVVPAGFVSPPIPVNQYSVVQVAPNATPGSVSVLYSQDSDVYIRAGTATWTAWPNGSVTSSSSMMSNARMFVMMSAQSSAASILVSDPSGGVNEIVVSPWVGLEAGAMVFGSTVTFQGTKISFFNVTATTRPGITGTSFGSLSLSSGALASTLAIALNTLGLINCTSVAA